MFLRVITLYSRRGYNEKVDFRLVIASALGEEWVIGVRNDIDIISI